MISSGSFLSSKSKNTHHTTSLQNEEPRRQRATASHSALLSIIKTRDHLLRSIFLKELLPIVRNIGTGRK